MKCFKGIIGIDFDDTITCLNKYMEEEAKKYDLDKKGKGIVNKSSYLLGDKYGWTNEEKETFFKFYRPRAIEKARLRPNAVKVFKRLIDNGYKIIIITARSPKYYDNPYDVTKNWLDSHKIPYSKLIVDTSDKALICKKEKIDYFIDDMPSNCLNVIQNCNIKVYMMNNGGNKCDNNKVKKIYNFISLYEEITNENWRNI